MPSYDPQRNRPRQRPKEDEPVPVDALLGADAPVVAEPAAPDDHHGDDHGHDHDHDGHHDSDHHDHDHGGPDPALALGVAVLSACGALVLAWRWWHRRHPSS